MTDTSARTTLSVISAALGLAIGVTAVLTVGLSGCDEGDKAKQTAEKPAGAPAQTSAEKTGAEKTSTEQKDSTPAPATAVSPEVKATVVALPTTSAADLIAAREAWGRGAASREIEAPLAAGAAFPLPKDEAPAIAAPAGETIVHPLEPTPVAQLTAVPADTLAAALKTLLATREGWLKSPAATGGGSTEPAAFAVLPTTTVEDLIKAREAWGEGAPPRKIEAPLANGAAFPLPQDAARAVAAPAGEVIVHALEATPAAELTAVPADTLAAALTGLLSERESWGTEPSSGGLAVLPTSSVENLFRMRGRWGAGPAPREVAAPLANGATFPLPKETGRAVTPPAGETIVHALESTPVATLTAVPAETLETALKNLFSERESWGTEPSMTSSSTPILPTSSVEDLFRMRESWGEGPAPRKVAAPLAKGAAFPLPKDTGRAIKVPPGETIVHPLEEVAAAQLTPVPAETIDAAMKALLATRESWGTEPSKTIGYWILPTTSVGDLIAVRESWGTGPAPDKVTAPLANGAAFPLPADSSRREPGPAGDPIIRPYEARPVPQLTAVPQAELDAAMKALLKQRESWGTSPSSSSSTRGESSATVVGYPALPTTGTDALFALRDSWGARSAAAPVRPPLANGAVWPLPQEAAGAPAGPTGEVIVHALEQTAPAKLSAVPQEQLADALKRLFAEREGWLKAPAVSAPKKTAAVTPRSVEVESCEAKLREAAAKGVILFQLSSARLEKASNATLSELAKVAKSCAKGRIRVGGHTDATGRADFNQRLSELRAKAVADALVKAGVKRNRIEAVGYGQERPVAGNDTEEGRSQNRRIEFEVLE